MKHSTPKKTAPVNGSAKKSPLPGNAVENGHDKLTVVGIGASAGGIDALKQFFTKTPADSGMAFVVIMHLSEEHESSLALILQVSTKMPVTQVIEMERVEPNHVYVIPPGKGLALLEGHIKLTEPTHVRGQRVPIDMFFRTLADAYGKNGIAVVLSGTGSDGSLGLGRIKENGGFAIVQDPAEAEYDGMPQSAINTGCVDLILPVAEIPGRLTRLGKNGIEIIAPSEKVVSVSAVKGKVPDPLQEILAIVRVRTGHDFSNYKHATVLRRIARRLQLHEIKDMTGYLAYVRKNLDEANALQRDLLITVTNFFRDKDAWEVLEREIVPKLFAGKISTDTVRVWSVGCATGDEAYSLAILLDEYAQRTTNAPKIQVFASDINEEAVTKARECFYDETIVGDVSPDRLRRYFVNEGYSYRVRKEIRGTVLFSPHNILRDPPFSKLDLITCRNLLIYFSRETQDKVFEIFNFALKRDGFLFLGASESAESSTDLFAVENKKYRIYKAKPISHFQPLPAMPESGRWSIRLPHLPIERADPTTASYGDMHMQMVEQFAPPSVLVDDSYEIVHISEHAGRFLRVAGGEPSRNLLKLVKPELKLDLQSALFEAKKDGFIGKSRNVRIKSEPPAIAGGSDTETFVNITVRLIRSSSADGFYLVIFDESKSIAAPDKKGQQPQTISGRDAMDSVVNQLEKELQINRERLRATDEQNETSQEELKASNEELQAINEELRSASEELETSKEELQSLNEELTTLNHELKDKVDETLSVNSDLKNIIQSTDIGTIFLDRALKLKRYTPLVTDLFNIIPSDIGRPLDHLTHKLDFDHLTDDAANVLKTLHMQEREVRGGGDDSRYLVRLAPYRTIDDKIDGVVLSFQDITDLKRASDLANISEDRYRTLFSSIDEGFCVIEKVETKPGEPLDFRYIEANPAFALQSGVDDVVGKTISQMFPDEPDEWYLTYEAIVRTGKPLRFERSLASHGRVLELYAFRVLDETKRRVGVIFKDITARKLAEEASARLAAIVQSSDDAIISKDLDGVITSWNAGATRLFGYTAREAIGQSVTMLIPAERLNEEVDILRHIRRGERIEHYDTIRLRKDGSLVDVSLTISPIRDSQGNIIGASKIARDITERKDAEENLRRSEENFRTLADSMSQLAWMTDAEGWIFWYNERWFEYTGSTLEEMQGWGWQKVHHPSTVKKVTKKFKRHIASGEPWEDTFLLRGNNGEYRWFLSRAVPVRNDEGKIIRWFGTNTDIDEVRRAEDILRLSREELEMRVDLRTAELADANASLKAQVAERQKSQEERIMLLKKVLTTQEDERRRIARDMHDHFGQQLTALRLQLELLENMCVEDAMCEKVGETKEIAKQLDSDVSFLVWELRPTALDDLGLKDALAHYIEKWTAQFEIPAELHARDFDGTQLSDEAQTCLYRIAQEALNNTYKYAEAKQASVLLEHKNGKVAMIIEDNGIGFDTAKKTNRRKGLGLIGMHERAALVGGTVEIESKPGHGTTIFVRIPLKQEPAGGGGGGELQS